MEDMVDTHMCYVCYETNKLVALPCGHLCCDVCFDIIFCKNRDQKCPYCRKNVRELDELAQKLIKYVGKLIPLEYQINRGYKIFTINEESIDSNKIRIYEPMHKTFGTNIPTNRHLI